MESMGNLRPSPLEGDAVAARPLTPELAELRRQYEEPHYLELESGERLKYTVVKPTHETEQTEWAVMVGGFSSTKDMSREEIMALAKSGRRVVFATPDRGTPPNKAQASYFQNEGETIPATIQNKAAAVKKLLDHLGIKRANLIGQSQGAITATSLAEMYPDLVQKLVLIDPAGIAKQPLPTFLIRSATDGTLMALESKVKKLKNIILRKYLDPVTAALDKAQWDKFEEKRRGEDLELRTGDPKQFRKWRYAKEVPDIGKADILPLLERMQKKKKEGNGEGPQIWLVNANSDLIFPARKIDNALGTDEGSPFKFVDRHVNYLKKDAQHGAYKAPNTDPTKQEKIVTNRQNRSELLVTILDEDKTKSQTEAGAETKTA